VKIPIGDAGARFCPDGEAPRRGIIAGRDSAGEDSGGQPPLAGAVMHFLVVQDYKENRRKCTLTALQERDDVSFLRLRHPSRPSPGVRLGPGILLHIDGDPLCFRDRPLLEGGRLMVLDATWARAPVALRRLEDPRSGGWVLRSLPRDIVTAYPRVSKLYKDPPGGLASVEALFAATVVLGEPIPGLLTGYRWAGEFLSRNAPAFRRLCPEFFHLMRRGGLSFLEADNSGCHGTLLVAFGREG
jgi:pre-rRNA-processing protein TSR3